MKEENDKIKKELEQKKQEIIKLKDEKESILNKNEILTQTLNEYKINLEEKNKIVERLTEKRINQLGEGETSLPLNINQNNNSANITSFNNLLISSSEKIDFQFNDIQEINKWKYYEINDVENFIISTNKKEKDEKNNNKNEEFDINQFTLNLKSAKKQFGDTIVKIDDNLNDMKHYLKKNDTEFKDKFLSKIREFNNVIYELKDKIINSIETTMEKINKEMNEGKNRHEKLLKDKISEDEKIIKNHELECKPKIEQLLIEVEKWKVKANSIEEDIKIKSNMIKQLEENIKRINEELGKKNKIIQNYESTCHSRKK